MAIEAATRRVAATQATKDVAKFGWRGLRRITQRADLQRLAPPGEPLRLILGAGRQRRPGWVASDRFPRGWDALYLDVTKRFPVPDGSVDRVFCEHMIEHVPLKVGDHMLAGLARVLRPGGRLRIATPDVDRFLGLVAAPLDERARRYVREANRLHLQAAGLADTDGFRDEPLVAVNQMFYDHGHQFLYSASFLITMLERHGFVAPRREEVGESQDPEFVGIEEHGRSIGDASNAFETMVIEATRAPGPAGDGVAADPAEAER